MSPTTPFPAKGAFKEEECSSCERKDAWAAARQRTQVCIEPRRDPYTPRAVVVDLDPCTARKSNLRFLGHDGSCTPLASDPWQILDVGRRSRPSHLARSIYTCICPLRTLNRSSLGTQGQEICRPCGTDAFDPRCGDRPSPDGSEYRFLTAGEKHTTMSTYPCGAG